MCKPVGEIDEKERREGARKGSSGKLDRIGRVELDSQRCGSIVAVIVNANAQF